MHGFPNRIVSPEGETDITHPAAYFGTGQILLDPLRGFKKIDGIGFMLIHPRGYRKYIGIENNVIGIEFYLLGQDVIAPLTDLDSPFIRVRLTFFIKSHY